MKRAFGHEANSSCWVVFILLIVFFLSLVAYAQDSEFGRIIGDRKYFVEDPAKGGGRDYIVRNPRATVPSPTDIPSAKMDSTQQKCFGWTQDQRIGCWIYQAYAPRVAAVGDTIHVVWCQSFYSKLYRREVCYVRSTDGGLSWSDSVLLSVTDGVESIRPSIAVEGNYIYVVWEDWTSMDWGGIYFRKSPDGGTTWQPIIPIALRGVNDYDYYRPTIVAKDSSVFVAFAKNVDSDGMLKFKKSSDCGETWSQEIHISDRAVSGHWAKLVLNSAGLYIAYQNGLSIWCNRSTDWGNSWSNDIFISDMDSSTAQWPSIGADDNEGVYITWFDYKYSPYPWTGDIFLRRSTDNGETWDSITVLTNNHLCIESDVCADTSSVNVVWHDERYEGNVEIFHRRSTDSGFSWEEEERLTNAPYGSGDPWITTDMGNLYITWLDDRDYPEDRRVFFKKGYWYILGDVNSDRIVNVSDIVFLINYLFLAGPSPQIYESGDVNGNGMMDISDVVYVINFLFIGGPPPIGC
jgi:hypothetical protein